MYKHRYNNKIPNRLPHSFKLNPERSGANAHLSTSTRILQYDSHRSLCHFAVGIRSIQMYVNACKCVDVYVLRQRLRIFNQKYTVHTDDVTLPFSFFYIFLFDSLNPVYKHLIRSLFNATLSTLCALRNRLQIV